MRFWEVFETRKVPLNELGLIVPGVNITPDVKPGEIERQAKKFGNELKSDGTPMTQEERAEEFRKRGSRA